MAVTKQKDNQNDNVITKLKIIFMEMLAKQFYGNAGIDNRTNLYIAEVTFVKNVVANLTGIDMKNNDKLHDWACDLVDEIHKEFGTDIVIARLKKEEING